MFEKALEGIRMFKEACEARLNEKLNTTDYVVYFKDSTVSVMIVPKTNVIGHQTYKVDPELFVRKDATYICRNYMRNGEFPIMGTHEKYLLDCIAECNQLLNQ